MLQLRCHRQELVVVYCTTCHLQGSGGGAKQKAADSSEANKSGKTALYHACVWIQSHSDTLGSAADDYHSR